MSLIDDLSDQVVARYAAAIANPISNFGKVNPDIELRVLVYMALMNIAEDAYARGKESAKK